MKVRREPNRMPERGSFRRIANRSRYRWAGGYTYWATTRTQDGQHLVTGMGKTARQAVNDAVQERRVCGRSI